MIFVDTVAFLAIENRRDVHHKSTLDFRKEALEAGERQVTTDYILDEGYTIIRLRAGHTVAVQFGEDIRSSRILLKSFGSGYEKKLHTTTCSNL